MKFDYISEADLNKMHAATCELLIDCGVRVRSERFIEAAKKVGLSVSQEEGTENHLVKFTQEQIDEGIKLAPKKFTMYGIDDSYEIHWGDGAAYSQTCVGMPFIRDIETGERRNTNIQDEADFIRVQDALSNIDVISCITAQGIPEHAANAIQTACMVKNTTKPLHICIASYKEVEQVANILYTVAGSKEKFLEKPFAYLQPSPVSPLEYGSGPGDATIGIVEQGLPIGIIPCPMMGATGPMTLIGSVVQHNAEMLAGVIIAELMHPGLPVVMSPRVTFMDMSTAMGLWAAPEMGLAAASSVALTRYYGIPCEPAGFSCAAKVADTQAAFEATYNALLLGLMETDVIGCAGALDNALIASYEKLIIDNEISSMVKRARRGETVNDDTMAVETIKKVMASGKRDFLSQKHTRQHLRTELWKPIMSDRSLYAKWEVEQLTFEQRAHAEAQKILAEHHPDHLTAEQVAKIDAIVEAAIAEDPKDQVH